MPPKKGRSIAERKSRTAAATAKRVEGRTKTPEEKKASKNAAKRAKRAAKKAAAAGVTMTQCFEKVRLPRQAGTRAEG